MLLRVDLMVQAPFLANPHSFYLDNNDIIVNDSYDWLLNSELVYILKHTQAHD